MNNLLRNQDTTKHDYGHALLIAGAHGRMGCAILAARAVLRSGCGLLTVHLPSRCVDPMQAAFPEAMVSIDPSPTHWSVVPDLERYTAVAIGPGLGTEATEAMYSLLQNRKETMPLVVDADGLNIMAAHPEWLSLARGAVFTPHEGEYRRLFNDTDPQAIANEYGIIIVRKAHRTRIYAPDGRVVENQTGNAGMATAGSGDVLTGIILGMLCSNHLHAEVYDIVCRAVEIHGKLGDKVVEKYTQSSLIASDLVEALRCVSTDITGV